MQFFFQKLQIYSMHTKYNCNSEASLSDYRVFIYFIYLFISIQPAIHVTLDTSKI
jgi:hypothetical protein